MLLDIFLRLKDLIVAPVNFPDMLWILIPILASLVLIQIYFGIYKQEELGWNSAFSNSLIFIFISIHLVKVLYERNMWEYVNFHNALVIAVVIAGLTLMVSTLFHIFPKRIAYDISSVLPINIIAYITIVLVYSSIPIDLITIVAVLLFITLVVSLLKLVSYVLPDLSDIES